MKFFKALFGGLSKSTCAGQPRRPAARRRLEIEALENRLVPACLVTVADGALSIVGTSTHDSAAVYREGPDIIVEHSSAGDPAVSVDVFPAGPAIARISFEGLQGRDFFENNTALPSTAYGGADDDQLYGGSNQDVFYGGHGNDTLNGRKGDDILIGHAGKDLLFGGDGADLLYGGHDNDWLDGGAGDDVLAGQDGDDYLNGGHGSDTLNGGGGKDVLDGGRDGAIDHLWGKDGFDEFHWHGEDVVEDREPGEPLF